MRVCVCVSIRSPEAEVGGSARPDRSAGNWIQAKPLNAPNYWAISLAHLYLFFFFCGIHLYIFMGYNNVLVHMYVEYLVKITAMSHQYVSHLKLSISCFQTVVWWVCFILQNRNFRSLGSSPFPPFPVLAATFFFYEAGYYYSSCKWAHTISVLSCVVF